MVKGFSKWKEAYIGIERNVWILATAMFINRSGSMVLLFMSVYLTSELKFTIPQTGVVMAMFGAGSLVGAFVGGKWVDRVGAYTVMIWSLSLCGLMLLVLGYMKSYTLVATLTFLVTATGDAFRPANIASIARYTKKENYTRAIALNRLAMNLGFTFGPVFGGLLATLNYAYLFWVDGLTCLAAAFFIAFVLPNPSKIKLISADNSSDNKSVKPLNSSGMSPYRDVFYIGFLICTTIYASSFFQFFTTLPLYYKHSYQMSEKHIGWLMAYNGLGVAVIEMFLIYYIQNRWTQFKFISLGNLLLAFGYLILLPIHSTIILVISMTLITLSEMFSMPFMSTYAIGRAPKEFMGQYMALYSMSWSLAQILAPVLGTRVIEYGGFDTLWWVLAGLSVISFTGFRLLEKWGATRSPVLNQESGTDSV